MLARRAIAGRFLQDCDPARRRVGCGMTIPASAQLREEILQSLRMVIDPELGKNLVDLGLIYRVDVDERGAACVEMSTTTSGCPAAPYLKDAVHSAVWIVPGIAQVDVLLTYDPLWSPDRISDAISHKFAGTGSGLGTSAVSRLN